MTIRTSMRYGTLRVEVSLAEWSIYAGRFDGWMDLFCPRTSSLHEIWLGSLQLLPVAGHSRMHAFAACPSCVPHACQSGNGNFDPRSRRLFGCIERSCRQEQVYLLVIQGNFSAARSTRSSITSWYSLTPALPHTRNQQPKNRRPYKGLHCRR